LAKCYPQFGHNYNQVSRELMYNWFNKHLDLGQTEPVAEKPFDPVPPNELSVYDDKHPRPSDTANAEALRRYMAESSDKQIEELRPKDAKSLEEYRRVFGAALRAMITDQLPASADVDVKTVGEKEKRDGVTWRKLLLGRKGADEQIPALGVRGDDFDGTVVVWIHPEGKKSLLRDGKLTAEAKQILDRKAAILAVDVFDTGELKLDKPMVINKDYAGYTFGYNRPLLAQRVHDILTAVAFARGHEKTKKVHLVGWDKAGPWVLLARPLCGDAVTRTAADGAGFRFEKVRTLNDEMMLPGGLKYGGLYGLAALAAPAELYVPNHHGTGSGHWLKAVYKAAGAAERYQGASEKVAGEKVVEWLLR
jgi:hypothetical protein